MILRCSYVSANLDLDLRFFCDRRGMVRSLARSVDVNRSFPPFRGTSSRNVVLYDGLQESLVVSLGRRTAFETGFLGELLPVDLYIRINSVRNAILVRRGRRRIRIKQYHATYL